MCVGRGRSYGGGILELEPSECVNLFIPDPELVDEVLTGEVDDLLRQGMVDEARRLVDERVLVASLRIPRNTLEDFEAILETMQGRRLHRNRSSRVKK